MNEKRHILNNHKGELVYLEYTDGKVDKTLIGIIGNKIENSYVKIWYVKDGKFNSVFIPIFGISLISNYNYVWNSNEDDIYFKAKENTLIKTK